VDAFKTHVRAPYDALLDLDGFGAVCAISELLGGQTVYIPSKYTIFRKCIEAAVIREFNGTNTQRLARKYDVSERYIRRLVGYR
jgi:Mor family transcriptional regulator